MYTLADVLLWRNLAVEAPHELAQVVATDARGNTHPLPTEFVRTMREVGLFDGVCGFETPYVAVAVGGVTRTRATHGLTPDCFSMLGVKPAIGRLFGEDEPEPVAVMSYEAWQRNFGGEPSVLGATAKIDDTVFTIVGVTEEPFRGLLLGFPPELFFLSSQLERSTSSTGATWFNVLARRPSGLPQSAVETRMQALWPAMLRASLPLGLTGARLDRYLSLQGQIVPAQRGTDFMLRRRFGAAVFGLLLLGSAVLLLCVVNIGQVILSRTAEQRQNLIVRLSLGAREKHLVSDSAVEGLTIVVLGFALGGILSALATQALGNMLAMTFPGLSIDTSMRRGQWLSLMVAGAATWAVFVAIPVVHIRRLAVSDLRALSSRVVGHGTRAHSVLVVIQSALTVALLAVGIYSLTALSTLLSAPTGLDVEHAIAAQLSRLPGVPREAINHQYYRNLLDEISAMPNVEATAISRLSPLFSQPSLVAVSAPGFQRVDNVEQHSVSDGFFATLGIPLSGRDFGRDPGASTDVAIISRSLENLVFGPSSSRGRAITVAGRAGPEELRVVGIARDAVLLDPSRGNTLVVYRSAWNELDGLRDSAELLIRSSDSSSGMLDLIRCTISGANRHYATYVRPLDVQRGAALAEERLIARVASGFSLVGVGLVAVGIYGLLSRFVVNRRREMALRIALGASRLALSRQVVGQAFVLCAVGALIGLPLAALASSASVQITTVGSDKMVWTALGAAALLLATAAVAGFVPARRAMSANPAETLKDS